MSSAERLDIRDIAQEWREAEHDFTTSPITGAVTCQVCGLMPMDEDDRETPCDSPEYVSLCDELGCDADPDSLERHANDYDPSLILASDFERYAQELAEDIGAIPEDGRWPLYCIDWERAARELAHDYSMVTYDGLDYYVRSC